MKRYHIQIPLGLIFGCLFACSIPLSAQSNKWVVLENGKFVRFTDKGRALLTQFRDAYRRRKEAFRKEYKQYEAIDHAIDVVRLMKGNMLLHGGSGGGKTDVLSKKKLKSEKGKVFEIQMNQMMSEHPFIGGQDFDAARQGKFAVNVGGSLCESSVGIVDEAHNANPATLAALMSILNERQVKAGEKVIDCPIETVFFTLNQNPYELEQQFAENGWRPTAQALLNRFTIKAFVPNWLSSADQGALDDNDDKALDAWYYGNDAQSGVAFDWRVQFDWSEIQDLAKVLLRPTAEFRSTLRDFTQRMRSQTVDAAEASKSSAKNSYTADEVMPYSPTAKLSERLRERILLVVLSSVLLDLLDSTLIDDITSLERLLKQLPFNRFAVGPLSLWRAYLMLTTVTFGEVALDFPEGTDGKRTVDIRFGNFFSAQDPYTKELVYKPEDKREEQMIQYIKEEQTRFKTQFVTAINQHKDILEETAPFDGLLGCLSDNARVQSLQDVERLLFVAKQEAVTKRQEVERRKQEL